MLAGDAGLPAGPSFAEIAQIGQDHLAQDGLDGEVGQQPVQERLSGCLVEGIQAGGQVRGSVGLAVAGRDGGDGEGAIVAERGAGGFGGGKAPGQAGSHVADSPFVRLGVQPASPGERAGRSSPYRCSQVRRSCALTPVRRLSSQVRAAIEAARGSFRRRARRGRPPMRPVMGIVRSPPRRQAGWSREGGRRRWHHGRPQTHEPCAPPSWHRAPWRGHRANAASGRTRPHR